MIDAGKDYYCKQELFFGFKAHVNDANSPIEKMMDLIEKYFTKYDK
jgi:hypothetical protein